MNSTSRPKNTKQDLGKTNTQWHIGKQRNTPETSRGTSENFTQSLRTRHRNTLKPKGIGTVALMSTRVEYPWTNPDTFWPLSFVDELLIVKNLGVEMANKK